MNIFVSYTLRDGILDERKLNCLYLALRQGGDPYIDVLHNKSADRQAYVVEQLNKATMLVACVTTGFFASEWVQFELLTARARGIPIVTLDMQTECYQKQIILPRKIGHFSGTYIHGRLPFSAEMCGGFGNVVQIQAVTPHK